MRDLSANTLSLYRTELMGFATICILVSHSTGVQANLLIPGTLKTLLSLFNFGVDIFLLLSGIGMFYSLHGKKDRTVGMWYKKRYVRLLLSYFIIAIPYWSYLALTEGDTFGGFLFNLATLSFWTKHVGAWFVAMLIPLYSITPLHSVCYDKIRGG